MVLAFYYHYPVVQQAGGYYLPGYVGCFVDALAKQVTKLILVAHTAVTSSSADYRLESKNIHLVNLGPKTPAWHRHLFHARILKPLRKELRDTDVLLVRSPTPLAPFFQTVLTSCKLVYLVVGDYEESVHQMKGNGIRHWLMKKYVLRNDALFRQRMRHTDILVNSPELKEKYILIAKSVHSVRTTTLSDADFFSRKDVDVSGTIPILFTGRISASKGLHELLQSIASLKQQQVLCVLHVVGWEEDSTHPVEQELIRQAATLGITDQLIFHGKKKLGAELNALYRMASLYVLPSYQEGFPRTLWEAMANSLPIITTSVGAIPHYVTHRRHGLLVEPKQVKPLADAIQEMITNTALRQHCIQEGFALAKENTLDIQTKALVEVLQKLSKEG